MGELDNRTAAVWGDTDGVGAAIARTLEAAGARVVADSGDQEVDAFLGAAAERLGQLDLAVVCVGRPGHPRPLVETSDERWRDEIDRHLGIAFRGVRRALAEMLPRGSGHVLVATSLESKIGHAGVTPYVAAQHGIAGLIKSVAHEVGADGVLVNGLLCGVIGEADEIEQALVAHSAIKRPTTPEDVAAAALTLASPGLSGVTGTLFPVHGGAITY